MPRPTKHPDAHSQLARTQIRWQKKHGRHDLPWQQVSDPYRIWLSEIMLQQTQVQTVIPYYARFLDAFPNVAALAAAPVEAVLTRWAGLGYYARARNLHACAKQIVNAHHGLFPSDPETLAKLPGIGRSTAAAIAVFAMSNVFFAGYSVLKGSPLPVWSINPSGHWPSRYFPRKILAPTPRD